MKISGLGQWTLFMLFVGVVFSILLTMPQIKHGTEVDFTVGKNDHIEIAGADEVNISVSSSTYFLIRSGEVVIVDEESNDNGDFTALGVIFTKNWQITDGASANVHISPVGDNRVLRVYKEFSEETNRFTLFLVWIVTLMFWLMILIIAK